MNGHWANHSASVGDGGQSNLRPGTARPEKTASGEKANEWYLEFQWTHVMRATQVSAAARMPIRQAEKLAQSKVLYEVMSKNSSWTMCRTPVNGDRVTS